MPETFYTMDDFLDLSPDELVKLKDEKKTAFLNQGEMVAVQKYFQKLGRAPTDAEFYMIDQNWCEHSAHGTGNGNISVTDYSGPAPEVREYQNLLRETILGAIPKVRKPFTVAACSDDAGIMYVCDNKGKRWGVSKKIETHNYPSKIAPFGGAHTGTGGVIRDILAVFGEPSADLFVICLPPPNMSSEEIPEGVKDPKVYIEEIVAGNQDYGNDMGIPTLLAGVHFSKRYATNPLVFAGSFGMVNIDNYKYDPKPGDVILSVGGKTGRDGVGAAGGSSKSHTTETAAKEGTKVQIGNPIEQQHWGAILSEKLFDTGMITYIQDCGGGGYSSAVWESAARVENGGATVYADRIPVKESGLTVHEKILSESQERQIITVRRENADKVMKILEKYGVSAAEIGELTGDGKARVYENQGDAKPVVDLDMDFLQKGKPKVKRNGIYKVLQLPEPDVSNVDLGEALLGVMSNFNVASKEPIIRRFDHQVHAKTVIQPLMGADLEHLTPNNASVQKMFYDENRHGQVISYALNPRWGQADMKRMVRGVFDQAVRSNVAHGGDVDHMTVAGNWSMANMKGDDEEVGRFAVGAEEFGRAEIEMDKCIDSGKDSMNNSHKDLTTGKVSYIPPTLLVTAQSRTTDVRTAVSSYAKRAGDFIYLVGETGPELGGSIFYENLGFIGNNIPTIDLRKANKTYRALGKLIRTGIKPSEKIIRAAHSVTEGGLGAAVAQMAIGGNIGAEINLVDVPARKFYYDHQILFSESLGRMLVEVPFEKAGKFERGMAGYPCASIGRFTDDKALEIFHDSGRVEHMRIDIEILNEAWRAPLRGYV